MPDPEARPRVIPFLDNGKIVLGHDLLIGQPSDPGINAAGTAESISDTERNSVGSYYNVDRSSVFPIFNVSVASQKRVRSL